MKEDKDTQYEVEDQHSSEVEAVISQQTSHRSALTREEVRRRLDVMRQWVEEFDGSQRNHALDALLVS